MDSIVKAPKSMIHGDEMILLNKEYIESFLKNKKDLAFIEVGSQRGTGSTYRLSRYANEQKMHFITVDPDENNSKGAGIIAKEVNNNFEAINELGEKYLEKYNANNIGICYLDAFDLIVESWPHVETTIQSYKKRNAEFTNEAAYKMHLEASVAIVDKVVPGGFICFDDVWKNEKQEWSGKGKTAIPFLLNNGFVEICYYKNSALFQKTTSVSDKEEGAIKAYKAPIKLSILYLKRKIASII